MFGFLYAGSSRLMVGDINRGLGGAQGWGRKGGMRERDKDKDGERPRDKENQGRERGGGRERKRGKREGPEPGREGGKQAGRKGKGRGAGRQGHVSLHAVLLSAASKPEAHRGTSPHTVTFQQPSWVVPEPLLHGPTDKGRFQTFLLHNSGSAIYVNISE